MEKWRRVLAFGAMTAMLAFVSACSSGNSGDSGSSDKAGNPESANKGQNEAPSTDPADTNKQVVELTTVRGNPSDIKWDPGENMDKNAVYDAYEKDLGIRIKNVWVADSKQLQQKLNMMIASNDIPDFFSVDQMQLQQLIEADMIMDITDVFEQYATEETKAWYTKDGGRQLKSAKADGRLMAIPLSDSPYNSSSYLWVRKDWLQKLNLPEPKTMQDVLKISEEFTKQDPGGTGKSYGMTLHKDLLNEYGLTGFFNGYHAYPQSWKKDADGKLAYGSIQPEVKVALKQLQDMYKSGQIDPEFGTKDPDKENELVAGDKIGMAYGAFWLSAWPLESAAIKEGKLVQDWEVYPLPSIDATPAKTQVGLGVNGYVVISKDCKNPEAVIQILNQWVKLSQNISKEEKVYMHGKELVDKGKLYFKINPIRLFSQDGNVQAGAILPKAIEAKDPSLLNENPDMTNRYDAVQRYLQGDMTGWLNWMIAKPGGSMAIMNQYLQEDRYQMDEFYGAPTITMQEKKSVLDAKEKEVFTKIIMNQVSIDEFDKFVEEWKSLGGEKITQEVNEWYASQK
ncbi:extracellular solute-binding protein [Paenibacillus sp. GCM10027626]|uniref:extracellular solute-binding protein n=1 Tax=Paenibacillus sp. GCM10027626 TaxID=3273411 RepID=UPI00363B10CE